MRDVSSKEPWTQNLPTALLKTRHMAKHETTTKYQKKKPSVADEPQPTNEILLPSKPDFARRKGFQLQELETSANTQWFP
jgi:hypothetical protein